MSAGSFVAYRQDVMDPRHGAVEGVAWAKAVGGAQDSEMSLLRAAALARLPVYVPDDGLDACGVGFLLPRQPGETNASYRARLISAWLTYAEAGSAQALVDALHAFGITDVRVAPEEVDHAAATAYNGASTYNKGILVKSNGAIYEQVGPNNAATASMAPFGQGQLFTDGSCLWAWRCYATADANDPGYAAWWYSRFDVVLGGQTVGNFGTTAVNKFAIKDAVCTLVSSPTVPLVGSTVQITISSSAPVSVGQVIYISQMGYYGVTAVAGTHSTLLNYGDAAAAYAALWATSAPVGGIFAPDTWGAPGQFPNVAPGNVIAAGQQVVIGGAGIIGQTRLGIAIVDDVARVAIKALILRWKATHGYAGRIVLAYNGATLDTVGQPGTKNGTANIGRMIGINTTIPFPLGGFDRS